MQDFMYKMIEDGTQCVQTPLGTIEITVDGERVAYHAVSYKGDRTCPNIDGRYLVRVDCAPDGKEHELACRLKGHIPTADDQVESGEGLALKSFYKGMCKCSIGMKEGNTEYLTDGVCYRVKSEARTTTYVFGVAWLKNIQSVDEVETWYAADPTLIKDEGR